MLSKKRAKKLIQRVKNLPEDSPRRYYCKLLLDGIKYRLQNFELERYQPYPHQKKVHRATEKIRGLYGANRMGKSYCGLKEVCFHASGMYPRWWPEENKFEPPINIWCVIENFKKSESKGGGSGSTHGDQIEANLGPMIKKYPTREKKRYVLKNGSIITLKTYKQQRASFESESIKFIYFDEECPEEIYNAGMARTIDCGGRILITLTAVEGAEWFHKLIEKDKEGDDDVFIVNEDIYANKSLSEEEIDRVKNQYEGREKMIRIHGSFVPSAGKPVFDSKTLEPMRENAVEGQKRWILTDPEEPEWTIDKQKAMGTESVHCRVFEEPEEKEKYVIGADPGGTGTDSSRSAAHVLKRSEEKIVCTVFGKPTQLAFGRALYVLGELYNRALVNVETNQGEAVVQMLSEQNYPNLYHDRDALRSGKVKRKAGVHLSGSGRVKLITQLEDRLETGKLSLICEETIKELSVFVQKDSGKTEAQYGKHDDLVMSLGLTVWAYLRSPFEGGADEETQFYGDGGTGRETETLDEIKNSQIDAGDGVIMPAD